MTLQPFRRIACLIAFGFPVIAQVSPDLYLRNRTAQTRWSSFENPTGEKGQGGKENGGAKGHPSNSIKAGESRVLLDVSGAGQIRRMWFTLKERDPIMLRSLRLDMYWDGASAPAVSVPFGDFFGAILGQPVAFENELFASPEGKSFNCYIPMPFRKSAKVVVTNESNRDIKELFYDIAYLTGEVDRNALYFHAYWHRERWTQLGRDFEILPRVKGEGRFLGSHMGVMIHPDNGGWWGEGEVKVFLDGDTAHPTLVGTGTEDYIGTGWGQGKFTGRFQGSLIADKNIGKYGFYRYHVPDPVYFHKDIRVTIQQMGGASKNKILELMQKGVPMDPVTVVSESGLVKLLELSPKPRLEDVKSAPDAWTNAYRRDDWSAVAYFYLDSPSGALPKLAPAEKRAEGLRAEAPARP